MTYEFPFTVTMQNASTMRSPALFAFGFMDEMLPRVYAADPASDLERMGPAVKQARSATERALMMTLMEAIDRLKNDQPVKFSVIQVPYPVRDDDEDGDYVYSGFRTVPGDNGSFDIVWFLSLAPLSNNK